MAKWGYSDSEPGRRPPVQKYLYLQCDCDDSKYGMIRGFTPEAFMGRLTRAQRVYVARTVDIPISSDIVWPTDGRCVWLGALGQYEILTITKEEKGLVDRVHTVLATVDGGLETRWVCKHCISAARFIGRRMWNARHLHVHLAGDPRMAAMLRWHKHLAGGEWVEPKTMWLTRHVCVTGWGNYDYGTSLFKVKERPT